MPNYPEKIAVIFNSKYGSTKRYAAWIAEEINGDLLEDKNIVVNDLIKYDTIVFGGSLHAVGIKGVKMITKNYTSLEAKKIIVFAVGCSPGYKEGVEQVYKHNFSHIPNDKINFFYLRGAFNYENLSVSDKFLMNTLKAKIQMKKVNEIDSDAKALLACYDHPVDWTDKKNINPIIECIRTN